MSHSIYPRNNLSGHLQMEQFKIKRSVSERPKNHKQQRKEREDRELQKGRNKSEGTKNGHRERKTREKERRKRRPKLGRNWKVKDHYGFKGDAAIVIK